MKDLQGRTIDYMRISVTDRCNLRCKYCMPEGIRLLPEKELLTYEEILKVCRQAVLLGMKRFKVTGGEPLVRKGCTGLIRDMKRLQGVEQVTMTTNGILLGEKLTELLEAGLDGVNVSLDTLDRKRYEAITGSDGLQTVLSAINKAADAGLRVKINAVLQPGVNDSEWRELLEFARERRVDVRFIEMMPIGYGKNCGMVSGEELLEKMKEAYPDVTKDETFHGNGPAEYYRIPGFTGSIGFISAVHGVFCKSCNRLRMTAMGELKPCLCYRDSVSVREAVRNGNGDKVRDAIKRAVLMKPEMHCFGQMQNVTELKRMVQIGG